MLKKQNVDLLVGLGFTVIIDDGDQVFLDSHGEDCFGPVVQACVYPNRADTWSVDLDGGFLAPAVDNMELLVEHLDKYFPNWR